MNRATIPVSSAGHPEADAGTSAPAAVVAPARFLFSIPEWLGCGSAALLVGLAAWGWDYFELPLAARPGHPKHQLLRSSGTIGLSLALAGTALMLLNLTYLLRKWIPLLHRFGNLRRWMAFHVLTGLVGPAMIVLHSGFLPTSALGTLSLFAMAIVVLAGILGRYIYSRVPRSLTGRELEIEEVQRRLGRYHEKLAEFGVDARRVIGSGVAPPARGIPGAIVALFVGDRRLRRQWNEYRRAVLSSPKTAPHASVVLPLLKRVVREGQWLARYHELRSLMGSWRFIHRWLAVVMLLLAGFHIYIAIRFGDLWVLS